MTNEIRRMIRGAIGGAFLGGFSGSVLGFIGTLFIGLEPVVFLACGVYAGFVYGGIVGGLIGARDEQLESAPQSAALRRRGLVLATAIVRSPSR